MDMVMRGFGDIKKEPNGNGSSETIQYHWRGLKDWTLIKRSMNLKTLQKKERKIQSGYTILHSQQHCSDLSTSSPTLAI